MDTKKLNTMDWHVREAAREMKPYGAGSDWDQGFRLAYMRGANDLARLVGLFAASVRREIEIPKNEYERGQRDGAKWAAEVVEDLIK